MASPAHCKCVALGCGSSTLSLSTSTRSYRLEEGRHPLKVETGYRNSLGAPYKLVSRCEGRAPTIILVSGEH